MPKPMLLTSVSTLPTACGGAFCAVSAENCGESPATVMPHSSSHSANSASPALQQPRRQHAAQAAERQLPGRDARAADAPRPPAAGDAAEGADAQHREGRPRQRRAGQARGQDRRHQHPHRVQLPHVAEVAEHRGAHLAVGPDAAQRAPAQARALARRPRPLGQRDEQQHAAQRRRGGHGVEDHRPRQRRADARAPHARWRCPAPARRSASPARRPGPAGTTATRSSCPPGRCRPGRSRWPRATAAAAGTSRRSTRRPACRPRRPASTAGTRAAG